MRVLLCSHIVSNTNLIPLIYPSHYRPTHRYQTFQSPSQVMMLMEFIQGGELWSLIYEKGSAVRRNLYVLVCVRMPVKEMHFYAIIIVLCMS